MSTQTNAAFQRFLTVFAPLVEQDPAQLSPELLLDDLPAWDSLAMVMFVATMDQEYAVQLDGAAVTEARTVGDLFAMVSSEQG